MRTTLILCLCISSSLKAADTPQQISLAALEDSGPQKIAKLVLTEAYNQLGYKVKYRTLPGKRALEMSNAGQIDGEVGRISGINKTYSNLIQLPTPISKLQGVFIGRKNITANGNRESIKGYRLAAFSGSKFVERSTKGMNVEYVPAIKNLFKMLQHKHVDLIIVPKLSGLGYIAEHNLTKYHALPTPLSETNIYHYLHSKHATLANKLEKVLSEMEANGKILAYRKQVIDELLITANDQTFLD